MSRTDDRDEVTGRTVAEMETLAEDLYEHRYETGGDEVPAEHVSEVRSVVSVRFARGELDTVAAAASAAGLALSTYIRNAALAAAVTIDIEAARRDLRAATKALDQLGRTLGPAA
jgi:predicted DNA binding CopG/RHH family protein